MLARVPSSNTHEARRLRTRTNRRLVPFPCCWRCQPFSNCNLRRRPPLLRIQKLIVPLHLFSIQIAKVLMLAKKHLLPAKAGITGRLLRTPEEIDECGTFTVATGKCAGRIPVLSRIGETMPSKTYMLDCSTLLRYRCICVEESKVRD